MKKVKVLIEAGDGYLEFEHLTDEPYRVDYDSRTIEIIGTNGVEYTYWNVFAIKAEEIEDEPNQES